MSGTLDGKAELKKLLTTTQGAFRRLIDDITEDESLVTINGNPNHIKWITGHALHSATQKLKAVGGEFELPEKWVELFRRGAPVSNDIASYPPFGEIREKLFQVHESIEKACENVSEDHLARPFDSSGRIKSTNISFAFFLAAHEFYHAGQIMQLRRHLGRDRLFG